MQEQSGELEPHPLTHPNLKKTPHIAKWKIRKTCKNYPKLPLPKVHADWGKASHLPQFVINKMLSILNSTLKPSVRRWQTQQKESAILTYAAVSPQFAFLNGELCSPVYVYWKKGKRKQCHQPQYTLTARAQWLWEAHTRYKAHKTYHETVSLCEKQSRGKQICNGLAQHRIYDLRHWNETATRPQAHIPSGANPHQGQGSVESDRRGVIVLRIYRFQKVGQTITRDTLQRPKLK